MKKDKLLQHQLKRLNKLFRVEQMKADYGEITTKGERIVHMIGAAINRSLARFRAMHQ